MYNKDNIWGVVFTANGTKFQIIKSGREDRVSVYSLGGGATAQHANWSVSLAVESLNKGWWTPLHPLITETYQIF